ncbi:MAG: aa3-type cytochrome c oxidase subunit IV [Alphaproteobacteria bacterium HGW-Alphaproteobacteria-13]|jgi:hypothetical protein|nr:MAG: aa3-type cytochrome c oxidase subunit IV [Alphaproteobacteria bacterium HGW-Alphaproteobacteria-13]
MADQDIKAANETYSGFLSLMKIGTILSVIATGIILLLIA